MDNMIVPPVPSGSLSGGYVNKVQQAASAGQNEAVKALTSMFMQTMLREIYKDQFNNGLFHDEKSISSAYFSDIFADQMINEMAQNDVFGLGRMISSDIQKRTTGQSVQDQQIM